MRILLAIPLFFGVREILIRIGSNNGVYDRYTAFSVIAFFVILFVMEKSYKDKYRKVTTKVGKLSKKDLLIGFIVGFLSSRYIYKKR